MVERSRRKREMNDIHFTRMVLTTAVLAAVAALIAGPSQAMFTNDGGPVVTSEPVGLTGDSAQTRADRTAVAVDNTLDPAIKTAIAAHEDEQLATQAAPGAPGTIPYLSHGIGVDESLFAGPQPSVGLTGDSALTRGDMPSSSTTQAVSSGDDFDWTWVGVGGGLAVLLAAAMGGFYLAARHRGRIALP
jgi:hypothetical protein